MDHRTEGHELQPHAASDLKRRLIAGHDSRADFNSLRSQNVALFAVFVIEQGDEGGSIWIVLHRGDFSGDPFLISLEIDKAELLFVAAAFMTTSNMTAMVTPVDASF